MELGVIIEDPGLATYFADYVDKAMPVAAYEAFLNDDGKMRWRIFENGVEKVCDKEPETSW